MVNGCWAARTIDVTNPANGQIVVTTANGDAADATRAVDAAARAFATWSRVPAKRRAAVLRNWFNLLMENADPIIEPEQFEEWRALALRLGFQAASRIFVSAVRTAGDQAR